VRVRLPARNSLIIKPLFNLIKSDFEKSETEHTTTTTTTTTTVYFYYCKQLKEFTRL